jgi:poly(beta-D-mannuronate) lyase
MSNTIRTTLLATMLFSLGAVGANTARACEAPPPAVIDIDANSYYTDKNHSVIDPVRKARNEAATRPVDAFLEAVARNASAYQAAPEAAPSAKGGEAQCALQWLSAWAKGGAMLGRMSSNQSYYTRKWALGGLALSYAKLKPAADAGQRQLIEPWLKALAEGTVVHSDANKGVRNNHYYWEGLAVASVGAVTGDERFLAWGRKVFDHAMSQIAADGSLPLEMARASKALHYHSFAAEPLVMLASVLDVQSPKLDQLVRFTLQGIADPSGIEKATGITQERLRGTPSWKTVYDRHAAAAGTPVTSGTPNLWQPRMGGDLRLPNPLEHVVRQQS